MIVYTVRVEVVASTVVDDVIGVEADVEEDAIKSASKLIEEDDKLLIPPLQHSPNEWHQSSP